MENSAKELSNGIMLTSDKNKIFEFSKELEVVQFKLDHMYIPDKSLVVDTSAWEHEGSKVAIDYVDPKDIVPATIEGRCRDTFCEALKSVVDNTNGIRSFIVSMGEHGHSLNMTVYTKSGNFSVLMYRIMNWGHRDRLSGTAIDWKISPGEEYGSLFYRGRPAVKIDEETEGDTELRNKVEFISSIVGSVTVKKLYGKAEDVPVERKYEYVAWTGGDIEEDSFDDAFWVLASAFNRRTATFNRIQRDDRAFEMQIHSIEDGTMYFRVECENPIDRMWAK